MHDSFQSFPSEFRDQIQYLLGYESPYFFESLQSSVPVSIRCNPGKSNLQHGEKVKWCQIGFYLKERPVFTLDPLFHAGTYYVQEASSMFLEQVILQTGLDKTSIRAIDLCAAPGGKSTHLLSLLHKDSLLVSNEVIKSRIPVLQENIIKWGNANCFVSNNDPKDFSKLENYFDLVVCDAPCSGEGLFRKDKNAINEWSSEQVTMCSLRQQRIVQDIWPALKPGGILVYSTCTYNEKENEDNINHFCDKLNADCVELDISEFDGIHCNRKGRAVCYKFFPHKIKGEGFCIAVLKKSMDGTHNVIKKKVAIQFTETDARTKKKIVDFVTGVENKYFLSKGEEVFFINRAHINDISLLSPVLKVYIAGTALGEFKHDDFIPSHSLAVSIHLNQNAYQRMELSQENALRLLKGQTQFDSSCDDGYLLATYMNTPFAFLKKIKNRFNNLYPKSWRIRMNIDLR